MFHTAGISCKTNADTHQIFPTLRIWPLWAKGGDIASTE